jgi:hypothetical protein
MAVKNDAKAAHRYLSDGAFRNGTAVRDLFTRFKFGCRGYNIRAESPIQQLFY